MRRVILAIYFSAVSGCVTDNTSIQNEENRLFKQAMDQRIVRTLGMPIKDTFSLLGIPSNKQELDDQSIYVWANETSDLISNPQMDAIPTRQGSYRLYRNETIPVTYRCVIKLVTKDGIVKGGEWSGNLPACMRYLR